MASHAFKTPAAALVLALAAHGAHAEMAITSMGQTASATASAQHSWRANTQSLNCCADFSIKGPAPTINKDASAPGVIGNLDQQASAHAEFEGIVADSHTQAHMSLMDDGVQMSSGGTVRHVFPAGVDLGPKSLSSTTDLDMEVDAIYGNRRADSVVSQKIGFKLDQDTQIRVDWSYFDSDPTPRSNRSFAAQQGYANVILSDANDHWSLNKVMQTEQGSFAILNLAAGDYTLSFTSFGGVTQATAGEKSLTWQALASIRAVPEASTWAMMGLGLAALSLAARRRTGAQA
jgi:PEP-CTERM motif